MIRKFNFLYILTKSPFPKFQKQIRKQSYHNRCTDGQHNCSNCILINIGLNNVHIVHLRKSKIALIATQNKRTSPKTSVQNKGNHRGNADIRRKENDGNVEPQKCCGGQSYCQLKSP